MRIQMDSKVRTVALATLEAMCARVSGTAHRYRVAKVSRSRVHVEYSNPDEYGNPHPMVAVFPCYPAGFGKDEVAIALTFLNVLHDNWNGEGWQAFQILLDCPTLWRDTPEGQKETWRSHAEILKARGQDHGAPCFTCTVCDIQPLRQ